MVKVLIDLDSIKKNRMFPSGGSKNYIPGNTKITFICNGDLPNQFKEGVNVVIDRIDSDHLGIRYEGTVIGDIDYSALRQEIPMKDVIFKFDRDMLDVSTIGDVEYYFNYLPLIVKCKFCGKEFDHSELESDDYYDGEEDHYSSEVCPNCEGWDCVDDLEFEDMIDALQRKEQYDSIKDLQAFEEGLINKITGIPKIVLDDSKGNGGC